MDKSKPIINEETKATSQHQITIPKKIWDALKLKPGARFQMTLTNQNEIIVKAKGEELELDEGEWDKLVNLAHSKKNVSKKFSKTKEALDYLNDL